jgi:hypothetical protein
MRTPLNNLMREERLGSLRYMECSAVRPGAGHAGPTVPHLGQPVGPLDSRPTRYFTCGYGQLAETIRTDVTFRFCVAVADMDPYDGDEAVLVLPAALEGLLLVPLLVVPLLVDPVLVDPVVPVAEPVVLVALVEPLGLVIDVDAEALAPSRVPMISTLWPTCPFSLSSSEVVRR